MPFYDKDALWKKCFKEPSKECDELHFVSGYFSMEMFKTMCSLTQNIKGIYGMSCEEGMSAEDISKVEKSLHIPLDKKGFHEKLYVWLKDGEPNMAFVGSSNFTNNGLKGEEQSEVLYKVESPEEVKEALKYLNRLFEKTKPLSELTDKEKEKLIKIYEKKEEEKSKKKQASQEKRNKRNLEKKQEEEKTPWQRFVQCIFELIGISSEEPILNLSSNPETPIRREFTDDLKKRRIKSKKEYAYITKTLNDELAGGKKRESMTKEECSRVNTVYKAFPCIAEERNAMGFNDCLSVAQDSVKMVEFAEKVVEEMKKQKLVVKKVKKSS